MKKVLFVLVMLLSVVAANAQRKVSEIKDDFKNGSFWIRTEKGSDAIIMFNIVEGTEVKDLKGDIFMGDFITVSNDENTENGNKFIKEKFEKADNDFNYKYVIMPEIFRRYGMELISYSYTDDGRVKVTFCLL